MNVFRFGYWTVWFKSENSICRFYKLVDEKYKAKYKAIREFY